MAQMQVDSSPGVHLFMRSPHCRGLSATSSPAQREQQWVVGAEGSGPLVRLRPPLLATDGLVQYAETATHGDAGGELCLTAGAPQQSLARIRQLETRLSARESKVRDVLDSALDFFENPFSPSERDCNNAEGGQESRGVAARARASLWRQGSGTRWGCGGEGQELDAMEEDEGEDLELDDEEEDEDEWVPPFAPEGTPSPRWSQGQRSVAAVAPSSSRRGGSASGLATARTSGGLAQWGRGGGDRGSDDGSSMPQEVGGGVAEPQPKRKRGRPKGSGKKSKAAAAAAAAAAASENAAASPQGEVQPTPQGVRGPAADPAFEGHRVKASSAKARSVQKLSALEDRDHAVCSRLPKLKIPKASILQHLDDEEDEEDAAADKEEHEVEEDEVQKEEEEEDGRWLPQGGPQIKALAKRKRGGRPHKISGGAAAGRGGSGLATPSHLCTASTVGHEDSSPGGRPRQRQCVRPVCSSSSGGASPPASTCSDSSFRSSSLVSGADKPRSNASSMITEGVVGPRRRELLEASQWRDSPRGGVKRGRGRPPKQREPPSQLVAADSKEVAVLQWPQQLSRGAPAGGVERNAGKKEKGKRAKYKSKGRTGRPRGRPPKRLAAPESELQPQRNATAAGGGSATSWRDAPPASVQAGRLPGHVSKQPHRNDGSEEPPREYPPGTSPRGSVGGLGAASGAAPPEKRKRGRPRKHPREEPGGQQAAVAAANPPKGGVEGPSAQKEGTEGSVEPAQLPGPCASDTGKTEQGSEGDNDMCFEDKLLSSICADVPLPDSVDDLNLATVDDGWLSPLASGSFEAGGAPNNDPFSDIKLDLVPDQLLEVLGG